MSFESVMFNLTASASDRRRDAAILQNPDYAALFPFRTPPITIRALGLNCGRYDMAAWASEPRKGLMLDYLGRDIPAGDPRFRVLDAIGGNYPPAFIATACHDFLREHAQPMYELLTARGVPAEARCYGTEKDKAVAHVFHVNILLPDAIRCSDKECGFSRRYVL